MAMMKRPGACRRWGLLGWLTWMAPSIVLGSWACNAEPAETTSISKNTIVTSPPQHVRLGFRSDFPINVGRNGSVTCASFNFSVNGSASIVVDMGADVTFAYDRADLLPGGNVPVQITYTPTNDAGPEVSVSSKADVTMGVNIDTGCVVASCFIDPVLCALSASLSTFSGQLDSFSLVSATGDFAAPLGAASPVVVPGTGDTATLRFAGQDLLGVTPVSSLTLTAAPPGAFPGLGGASALVSASGATAPLIPVVEWQSSSTPAVATITLPATPGPSATVTLSPLQHWLGTSASASINIELKGLIGDVFGQPAPIQVFSGALGPALGLDTLICSQVPPIAQSACMTSVAAGNVPYPALAPQPPDPLPTIPPLAPFASVAFTINLDSDGDGLLDGVELKNGTDPDNADTDHDGLSDGAEVNVYHTNPLDPDTDHDGLSDGAEVNVYGTNPLDPDTDHDLLTDGFEVAHGTNPLDPDSDHDGVIDGLDTEILDKSIAALPGSAFKANGQRTALLNQLDEVERKVAAHQKDDARHKIANIRRHLDGCPTDPDFDDWIIDCTAQLEIRALLDLMDDNLALP